MDWASRLLFSEHHLSHAASAFYPSPFKSAAILTLDGVGEWTTTSFGVGKGNELNLIKELRFPHSLGLLYSAFTYYLGFKVNSGEYKVMGLAPYGEPKYVELIKEKFVKVAFDGSFQLDMSYFDFGVGLSMTNNKFNAIFGSQPRKPETKITQMHMDIASSIQMVTAEIVIKLSKDIANITGEKNLCLAGGVALNCVVNGILLREKIFDKILDNSLEDKHFAKMLPFLNKMEEGKLPCLMRCNGLCSERYSKEEVSEVGNGLRDGQEILLVTIQEILVL